MNLTNELREEYRKLYKSMVINKEDHVNYVIKRIFENKDNYLKVQAITKVPWYFVASIHAMECSLKFDCHLHNGDPLTSKTKNVPKGRPDIGNPPFEWHESAIDAIRYMKLNEWKDWSIEGMLFKLEDYNGWGYRKYHSHVNTPYLWGYTNHYTQGKYVADGKWSETAVSKQIGAAAILGRVLQVIEEIADKDESEASNGQENNKPLVDTSQVKYIRLAIIMLLALFIGLVLKDVVF